MATIKSYTDLEQSKKLAEILPLESADMCYERREFTSDIPSMVEYNIVPLFKSDAVLFKAIPCWSLAALLSVLPNNENISTNLSKGGYRISALEYTNSWFVDYEDATNGLNNCATSADNPVDACYEMILKLHKLKML